MNTKTNADADEPRNNWHALPGMIGEVIEGPADIPHLCGGYIVRKNDDGGIEIYREVAAAATRNELEETGDYVTDIADYVVAGVDAGYISPPEGGWESEEESLPKSIWTGWA